MIAACVQWRIGAGVTVSVFAAIQLRSTPSLQHMSERRHSTRVVDTGKWCHGKWCQIYFPQKKQARCRLNRSLRQFSEFVGWRLEPQGFPWMLIESQCDRVELALRVPRPVAAFGQVLTQQAVGVLNVRRNLAATIPGQGTAQLGW